MRLLLLFVAGLILAGCGAAPDVARPPGSSQPGSTGSGSTTDPMKAPAILLKSQYGNQEAGSGSACVFSLDPDSGEGEGACGGTGPIHPKAVPGVAAGGASCFGVVRG